MSESIYIYYQSMSFEPEKPDKATLRFQVRFETENKEDMKAIMEKKIVTVQELNDFLSRAQ